MIPFLSSAISKANTLIGRITADRGTKLANLDANISTLAPASGALSNAVWTPTRAASLDLVKFGTRAFTDPRKLPLMWARNLSVTVNNGINAINTAAFWTTDLSNSKQYYVGEVATADTYVDVIPTVAGRGVFVGVMGPSRATTSAVTTFRITIDGAEYLIWGTIGASWSGDPRLLLWAPELARVEATDSYTSGTIPVMQSSSACALTSPRNAISRGYAHCYFNTSLRVEAKISGISGSAGDPIRKCLAACLLEKGTAT